MDNSSLMGRLDSIAESEYALKRFDTQIRKNEEITLKMVSTLNSFDERLVRLEDGIGPIYSSTRRYDQIDKNVAKSLQYVRKIVSFVELVEEEEMNINRGPLEDNIDPYLETMNRIKFAIDFLIEANLPNLEKSINMLRNLYKKAVSKVDSVFRTWLSIQTVTMDPKSVSARKGKSGFMLPSDSLGKLAKLAQILTITKDRTVSSQYTEIFVEIRSFHMDKSLQPLSAECTRHILSGKHKSFYEKGKHPLMAYANLLIQMFDAEKSNIDSIFKNEPADYRTMIYAKTIRPSLSSFIQTADVVLKTKSANINCKEFADILELLDLSGYLTAFLNDNEEVFPPLAADKISCQRDIIELVRRYDEVSMAVLPGYLKDLEKPSNRYPSVPSEATVHEISTDTINFLTKLDNYEEIVEMILVKIKFGTFIQYIVQVLKQLNEDILKLATLYKEDVKGIIFSLNNNHYILKALKKSRYDSMLGEEKLLDKYSMAISNILKRYLNIWEAIIDPCRNLHIEANSKSEKEPIKDICKTFLATFEETIKVQKSLSVPDYELRMSIIKEVKDFVIPIYTKFYEKYKNVPFTKNLSKYLKYEPNELEAALGSLFES